MRTPEEDIGKIVAGGKDSAPRVGNILEHVNRLLPEEELAQMLVDDLRTSDKRERTMAIATLAKLVQGHEERNQPEKDKDLISMTENQLEGELLKILKKYGVIPKGKPKKTNAAKKTE